MSQITFEVTNIFPGTEKQKAVGIYASFNLSLKDGDVTIVSLSGAMLKLRKETTDGWYIEAPFESYTPSNSQEKKKRHYFKFFPEKEHWAKQDIITRLVRQELEKKLKEGKTPAASTASSSTPENDIGW